MRNIEINLNGVRGESAFFSKMRDAFCLPNYFSANFDSLDECMRDLSWFLEHEVNITVKNLEKIKSNNKKLYSEIYESFEIYKEYWKNHEEKNVVFIFK